MVTPLLQKLFLGVLHGCYLGYKVVCIPFLNTQLDALSSALYQKFATFTVLLSFCFFNEKWSMDVTYKPDE